MPRNKNRLYIAYYERLPNSTRPDFTYHTAILWKSKRATPSNASLKPLAWRFHAVNAPDPATNSEIWKFVSEEVTVPRDVRLRALCLLGKTTETHEVVHQILSKVEVVQGDPSWRCRHWVYDAIELLCKVNLIPSLPMSVPELYETGVAISKENLRSLPATLPVPTFGINGERTRSEL